MIFYDNNDHSNHAGKTWERTSVGRVPVGIDTTQTEFDTIGETGGAKTHTLTVAEMPSHKHTENIRVSAAGFGDFGVAVASNSGSGDNSGIFIGNTGGGLAHNNLQPTLIGYMWERTA